MEINGEIQKHGLMVVSNKNHAYVDVKQICDNLGYQIDLNEKKRKIKLINNTKEESISDYNNENTLDLNNENIIETNSENPIDTSNQNGTDTVLSNNPEKDRLPFFEDIEASQEKELTS